MTITVTDENINEILNNDMPFILDFWAEWCGPCKMVSSIIDELATEYEGKVLIGKVDVDDNDKTVTQFGVRNIPTVLFFKNKQLVDKLVGASSKEAFLEKVTKLIN